MGGQQTIKCVCLHLEDWLLTVLSSVDDKAGYRVCHFTWSVKQIQHIQDVSENVEDNKNWSVCTYRRKFYKIRAEIILD